MKRVIAFALVILATGGVRATEWPAVAKVDAQPLIAQAVRLDAALESLGQPLPAATRKALASLAADSHNVASAVQTWLDPHCLAVVEIDEKGVARVVPTANKIPLVEQGWRAYLVKVINKPGATGTLRIDSPNARPLPFSPKDQIDKRWLGLLPHTAQPLLPNLSGLGLEYTVVQVFSRDAGEKTADLAFRVEGARG